MRVLAIDHGAARCGCAISDPTGTISRPLEPISPPDPAAVARLAASEGAELIVVGLPVSLDGTEGAQAAEARRLEEQRLAADEAEKRRQADEEARIKAEMEARMAAEEARRIQRDPSARAGAFIVIEASGAATWAIDLDD